VPIGAGHPGQLTSTTALSSTTSTTTEEEATAADIIAGYRTAEAVFLADANAYPVDLSDPRLAEHMTGAELATVRNFLSTLFLQSRHGVGTWDLAPMVTAINGSTAMITDCVFDHTSIVDVKTGQTVSGPDTQTTQDHITMVLGNGLWTVSNDQRVAVGCAPTA
jgi:hypothetical protein